MTPLRLLVIDDHPLLREGLTQRLDIEPDLTVVGAVGDGETALGAIATLAPDLILCDINLPGMSGLDVLRSLREQERQCPVIVLTVHQDTAHLLAAFQAGANAFLSKDIDPSELVTTIHRVSAGEPVIEEQVRDLLGRGDDSVAAEDIVASKRCALTARELMLLRYVAEGLSNKEVAAVLSISDQTVKNHMTNILRKLGAEDRTQAIMEGIRRGWIKVPAANTTSAQEVLALV